MEIRAARMEQNRFSGESLGMRLNGLSAWSQMTGVVGKKRIKARGQQPRIRMNTKKEPEGMWRGNNKGKKNRDDDGWRNNNNNPSLKNRPRRERKR